MAILRRIYKLKREWGLSHKKAVHAVAAMLGVSERFVERVVKG